MSIKQPGRPQVSQSTYGSPEHSQHPSQHPYTLTPDYRVPEANTPDQSVSSQQYGIIPTQTEENKTQDTSAQDRIAQMAGVGVGDEKFSAGPINGTNTYGIPKPTADQAAAGSTVNYPSGTYPPNPTPMQGPGDNPATRAVMPKLQVTGDPRQVYGVRRSLAIVGKALDKCPECGALNGGHIGDCSQIDKAFSTVRGHRVFLPDSEKISEVHNQMLSRGYTHSGSRISETGGLISSYKAADGSHSIHFFTGRDGIVGDKTVESHSAQKQSWKDAYDWPHTIVFDWNGTIDARDTGQGIPWSDIQKLIDAGKHVVVFTSSVNNPDDKSYMRRFLSHRDVQYTDDPTILDKADIFVGDKKSDRRRAGFHGVKYVDATDFDVDKLLAKSLGKGGPGSGRKPEKPPQQGIQGYGFRPDPSTAQQGRSIDEWERKTEEGGVGSGRHPTGALGRYSHLAGAIGAGMGIAGAGLMAVRAPTQPVTPKPAPIIPGGPIQQTQQKLIPKPQPQPQQPQHGHHGRQPRGHAYGQRNEEDVPQQMGEYPLTLPDGRQATMAPQHGDDGKYHYHSTPQPVQMPLDHLQMANRDQPLSEPKVQSKMQDIQQGRIKPLTAWENGQGGKPVVTDGHHRMEAMRRLGMASAPVVILSNGVAKSNPLRFAALKLFSESVTKPGYSHTVIDSKQEPEGQAEIGLGNVTRPQKEGKDVVTP